MDETAKNKLKPWSPADYMARNNFRNNLILKVSHISKKVMKTLR